MYIVYFLAGVGFTAIVATCVFWIRVVYIRSFHREKYHGHRYPVANSFKVKTTLERDLAARVQNTRPNPRHYRNGK